MKKFIFCLVAVTAIATLLLPSGQAFAKSKKSKWIPWPIGENSLDTDNWVVEPYNADCYDFEVVDGTLMVTAFDPPFCDGRRFFAKVDDGGQAKEIRADVTVMESYGCWRARLLADPLYVPDVEDIPGRDGTVFHQLCLVNDSCNPPTIARLLAYPAASPWLSLFDAAFRRPWSGPGNPDYPPIVGHKYTLTLSVKGDTINSQIEDMERSFGQIVFEVPGLEYVDNENFIGLSCFSAGGGYGTAVFSNVWVRY